MNKPLPNIRIKVKVSELISAMEKERDERIAKAKEVEVKHAKAVAQWVKDLRWLTDKIPVRPGTPVKSSCIGPQYDGMIALLKQSSSETISLTAYNYRRFLDGDPNVCCKLPSPGGGQ